MAGGTERQKQNQAWHLFGGGIAAQDSLESAFPPLAWTILCLSDQVHHFSLQPVSFYNIALPLR